MSVAVATIVSKNYLSFARVFAESFRTVNPGIDIHVLLVDRIDDYFDSGEEIFQVTEIQDLAIPDFPAFAFKYNVTELNTAAKPFFLDYLFRKFAYKAVLYFDPDILILRDISRLFRLLEQHPVILTPHITSPIDDDGRSPSEIELLRTGAYNLGFIGVANTKAVRKMLAWWMDRLHKYCFSAPEKGLFVDQKWIDLLPGFIDNIHILRHPGYNVAYWNLHERTVSKKEDGYYANDMPLYFFHFSGVVLDDLESLSKYQDRYRLKTFKELRPLFREYKSRVLAAEMTTTKTWPYAYGTFDSGIPVHDLFRQIFARITERGEHFGNPFATAGPDSFFQWLGETVPPDNSVTNLLRYIYHLRHDLHQVFPDPFGKDAERLIAWANQSFRTEYGFHDCFLPPRRRDGEGGGATARDASSKRPHGPDAGRNDARGLLGNAIWRLGTRYARIVKKTPLLNSIAEIVYRRLASQQTINIPPCADEIAADRVIEATKPKNP